MEYCQNVSLHSDSFLKKIAIKRGMINAYDDVFVDGGSRKLCK